MIPKDMGHYAPDVIGKIFAAAMFDGAGEGATEDGEILPLIQFGAAMSLAQYDELHVLFVAPVEITAALIAAIRENARKNQLLPALDAAIDRHTMMWRETR